METAWSKARGGAEGTGIADAQCDTACGSGAHLTHTRDDARGMPPAAVVERAGTDDKGVVYQAAPLAAEVVERNQHPQHEVRSVPARWPSLSKDLSPSRLTRHGSDGRRLCKSGEQRHAGAF